MERPSFCANKSGFSVEDFKKQNKYIKCIFFLKEHPRVLLILQNNLRIFTILPQLPSPASQPVKK